MEYIGIKEYSTLTRINKICLNGLNLIHGFNGFTLESSDKLVSSSSWDPQDDINEVSHRQHGNMSRAARLARICSVSTTRKHVKSGKARKDIQRFDNNILFPLIPVTAPTIWIDLSFTLLT